MTIYQSNTYRKDLGWLHFYDEPRVQEKQRVKDQQSCISFVLAFTAIPGSNQKHQPKHGNSTPWMAVWQIYRDNRATSGERNLSLLENQSLNFITVICLTQVVDEKSLHPLYTCEPSALITSRHFLPDILYHMSLFLRSFTL